MNISSKKLDRLVEMSEDDFQKYRETDEYREINENKDKAVRESLEKVLKERRCNKSKREKFVKAVFSNPEIMDLIEDVRAYRLIRMEEGFFSIISNDAENRAVMQSEMTRRSHFRRASHNTALTSFYRLVEKTSIIQLRDEHDIYSGRLMLPDETPDKYGNHDIREEMTDGMFKFLYLYETTSRSDWSKIRQELGLESQDKDRIAEMQGKLENDTRAYGLKTPPKVDNFGTNLYNDDKDR